jgi:hypothetical protein
VSIARRQLSEERQHEISHDVSVISDRSIIDALVYSLIRFPDESSLSSERDLMLHHADEKPSPPFQEKVARNSTYDTQLQRITAEILVVIQENFALTEFPSNLRDLLQKFHDMVLHPTHRHFGMLDYISIELQMKIESISADLICGVISSDLDDDAKLLIVMNMIPILSDLGISVPCHLAMFNSDDVYTALNQLVAAIRKWDIWLTLGISKRTEVLNWLNSIVQSIDDPITAFAHRTLNEQAAVYLHELKEGSEDIRSSSWASRVVNLRIEPNSSTVKVGVDKEARQSKSKTPIVTLYTIQAMPVGLRFARGEHVRILKQPSDLPNDTNKAQEEFSVSNDKYDEEFPMLTAATSAATHTNTDTTISKDRCYCLGRVMSVMEAPFSIKIKLIAPSYIADSSYVPHPIQECLDERKDTWFEIQVVPANVSVLTVSVTLRLLSLSYSIMCALIA